MWQMFMTPPLQTELTSGSKDGRGCADHDEPYTLGRRPRGVAPFPFTTRQYARLLALRGRIADGLVGVEDTDASGLDRCTPELEQPASNPTLIYPCNVCGAVVAGAYQSQAFTACPKCAQDGGRDETARAILLTAGVLNQAASG